MPSTLPAVLARAQLAHAAGDLRGTASLLQAALAVPGAAQQPTCERGAALSLLARAAFALARFEVAVDAAREAAVIWHAQGQLARQLEAMRLLAYSLAEMSRAGEALTVAREALDLAERFAEADEALRFSVLQATLYARQAEFDAAERLMLQAVSRARERPQPEFAAHALSSLMAVLLEAHLRQQRAGDTDRAAATARRIGLHVSSLVHRAGQQTQPLRRAVYHSNAGAALHVCGRDAEAQAMLETALALCREHGLLLVGMRALTRLAQLHLDRGRREEAAAAVDALGEWLAALPHARVRQDWLALREQLDAVDTG